MKCPVSNVKLNGFDKMMFAVFLLSLFGVVIPQKWDEMLSYSECFIPQLAGGRDYSKDVQFILFNGSNVERSDILSIGNATSLMNIDSSKKTILIIHGFVSSSRTPSITVMANALSQNCETNTILVDWSRITMNFNYPYVASQVRGVGYHVCDMLSFLKEEKNISAETVHLIGHSLGAHVAGFAGKKCRGLKYKPDRITGLDPAYPCFVLAISADRLDAEDASFVDIMHTSSGTYGIPFRIGDADWYVNRGFLQPSCIPQDAVGGVCSHLRVTDYFAESVNCSHRFIGNNCTALTAGAGQNCQTALMGYYTDPATRGILRVETNASPPYAKTISTTPCNCSHY